MAYLAILVMMLLAFAIVGWPLISSPRGVAVRRQISGGSPSDELIGERDAAYGAIKELDFEYELGNLSESDYRTLRERYRSDAAAALQKLESAAPAPAERVTTRAGAGGPAGEGAAHSAQAALTCHSCGEAAAAGDRFCWKCGEQLGDRCPNCSGPVLIGDRFCAACGTSVEAEG